MMAVRRIREANVGDLRRVQGGEGVAAVTGAGATRGSIFLQLYGNIYFNEFNEG